MLTASIILGLILIVLCFNSMRATVFVVLTVGIIQDPVRKLVPEEPVFFVVVVGIFFIFGMIGAILRNGARYFMPLSGFNNLLYYPLISFLIILFIQTLVTVVRYDQVALAVAGLSGYLAPLLVLPLAYSYVNGIEDVKRLLAVYIAFNTLVALGIYLSFFGVNWDILKQVGTGIVIYDFGTVLTAHSGFMRSPEIAAWHLAASVCMLGTISILTGRSSEKLWLAFLIVIFVGAIFLTGRRKMLMEVVVFSFLYFSILMFTRTGGRKLVSGIVMLVVGLTIWVGLQEIFPEKYENQIDLYLQRGSTVFEDAPQRLSVLGYGSVKSALQRVGWLGAGMGIGSQGARFFGDSSIIGMIGGSAEGGLGKIIIEVGVPGLLVLAWLLWRYARNIYCILQYCGSLDRTATHIGVAITAFLSANILTFIIASQVYGDLFILFLLGMLVGVLFAVPKITVSRYSLAGVEAGTYKYMYPAS